MGGSKKSAEIEVNEYLMSMHVGLCLGADALTGIYVADKPAWLGDQTTPTVLTINKPELFGGPKKEGGVDGVVHYLPGLPDQVMSDNIAQKFGRASGADCPGFRGLASLFFTGSSSTYVPSLMGYAPSGTGFHWVTNNPYLKDIAVGVKRAPKGLDPAKAMIPRLGSNGLVPFTSGGAVVLTWWQNTYPQGTSPTDKARMGIRYFDENGDAKGDIDWASMISTSPPMTWVQRTLNSTIPAGTYSIRIYMEFERLSGSYNDGYIDDIAMTIDGLPFPITNPGGETHNDSGWINETGNLGMRFSDPLPHTGTGYFTGGAYALTRSYQSFVSETTGPDANPAHIIYECLTDREWGMGAASTIIDVTSFEEAATTLLLEGFGLSLMWTQQTTIEAFITEIIDHIQAALFVNPRTGLLTLRLIRGGYNVNDLREITPDNAKMKNFQRKGWGEIINEVTVTWTNPETEQDETVTIQDDAAIAAQGGIVSDSRNYYGVRSSALAMKLAARDLRVSSTPLATCDVELNRTAWDLLPGDVIRMTWPERGLNNVPMRVGNVDYGKPGDPAVTASLMEDIFGYATTDYSLPPSTNWEDDGAPAPMEHSKIITVPAFFAANYLPVVGTGVADIEYPEVIAGVLASSTQTLSYDVYGDKVAVDGTTYKSALTTNNVAGWAKLSSKLPKEATSTFVGFKDFVGSVLPDQSVFVFIGDDDNGDRSTEIALITEVTDNSFTLKRGVLDTTPRYWAKETPCYFVTLKSSLSDRMIRSDAEEVTYQLITRSGGGTLDVGDAPLLTRTLNGRPHYPLRPANVKVNGVGFGAVDIQGVDPVPVTWANRNRTMENSQVVYWDAANVTPEVGQTTKIELRDAAGNVFQTYSGLTGVSYNVPASAFSGYGQASIRVWAERDGFDSLTGHSIPVYTEAGYGNQYGYDYGGSGTGSGTGGGDEETGGGVPDPTYPSTASWGAFSNVGSTTYTALTTAATVTVAAGDGIYGFASLSYQNVKFSDRKMNAKWQYSVAGSAVWVDMGTAVTGSVANGSDDDYAEGGIVVSQSKLSLAPGNYDIRLVANVNASGATLVSTGTATITSL